MINLSEYPKEVKLRNKETIIVRALQPDDASNLWELMNSLPREERVRFRDDVTNRDVVESWATDVDLTTIIPLIAEADGKIIANWTLHHREFGWTRHHAQLRGVVHPDWRELQISASIVVELLSIADKLDTEKVVIEFVSPQSDLLERYERIGFKEEAVLKNWVKDFRGRYNDLYILSMELEPAWRKMEQIILDYGTHGG